MYEQRRAEYERKFRLDAEFFTFERAPEWGGGAAVSKDEPGTPQGGAAAFGGGDDGGEEGTGAVLGGEGIPAPVPYVNGPVPPTGEAPVPRGGEEVLEEAAGEPPGPLAEGRAVCGLFAGWSVCTRSFSRSVVKRYWNHASST